MIQVESTKHLLVNSVLKIQLSTKLLLFIHLNKIILWKVKIKHLKK
jgi:hypothetical protein